MSLYYLKGCNSIVVKPIALANSLEIPVAKVKILPTGARMSERTLPWLLLVMVTPSSAAANPKK